MGSQVQRLCTGAMVCSPESRKELSPATPAAVLAKALESAWTASMKVTRTTSMKVNRNTSPAPAGVLAAALASTRTSSRTQMMRSPSPAPAEF